MKSRSWPLVLAAHAALLGGCGTNLNEVLLQSGTATGRTLIDLWLTDFEIRLADSFDGTGATSGQDGSTVDDGDGDQGGDNDGDGDGPPDQEAVGILRLSISDYVDPGVRWTRRLLDHVGRIGAGNGVRGSGR